jgi:hypothetical protein
MTVENPNEVPTGFRGKWLRERYGQRYGADDGAPMTLSQASYLMTLCEETGEVLDDSLTRAEAVERIKELELATGRGPRGALGHTPI